MISDSAAFLVGKFRSGSIGEFGHIKNRISLSDTCQRLLETGGNAAIYPLLFRTFSREDNWAYLDRYPEVSIVQMSFVFTLYMLSRQGKQARAHTKLAEGFLQAFPMASDEVDSSEFCDASTQAINCYTHRALRGYCRMLGLAGVKPRSGTYLDRVYTAQALPRLHDAVRFQGRLQIV